MDTEENFLMNWIRHDERNDLEKSIDIVCTLWYNKIMKGGSQ